MPDSAATPNVFLDTQVFDGHQLDFMSPNLRRFVRLAAAGSVRLVLTTVTISEVEAHLDKHAKEAFKQVKNYRRILPIVKKMLPQDAQKALASAEEEDFRTKLHGEFNKFLQETKAIVLSVDKVSPEAIFKNYFELKAPFAEGAKKSEFPDAFASAALQAWCKANSNAKVYVVSDDKDWRRVCQVDPALLHLAELSELLEKFADSVLVTAIKEALVERREELKNLIDEKAVGLDYYTSDSIPGEIDEIEEAEVEIEDFHVVEAKDGQAAVNVRCNLKYQVFVTADDPDSAIYDDETKEAFYVYRMSGSVSRDEERVVTTILAYDQNRPENVTIETVDFENNSVEVDIEEGELTREDDSDYYDMDMEAPEIEQPDYESPEV